MNCVNIVNLGDNVSYENGDPFDLGTDMARTARLSTKGARVRGVVLDAVVEQDREFDHRNPGKGPLLYKNPDGSKTKEPTDKPLMYPIYIVQAQEPDGDDDGRRAIRANKTRMRNAIRRGVRTAGAHRGVIGGFLDVEMIGTVPGKGSIDAHDFFAIYFTPEQVAEGKVPEVATVKEELKDDDPFA